MSFLDDIFARLELARETVVLRELGGGESQQGAAVTGRDLLGLIDTARTFLAAAGLKRGDRCALLAHNSIRWIAMDLAIMAEGLIVVPLYARQAPPELVAMMKDCSPALICCGDAALRDAILENWPEAPSQALFEDAFTGEAHPLQRAQRMGHPPIRGASCRAQHQPRLIRELVSSGSFTRGHLLLPPKRNPCPASVLIQSGNEQAGKIRGGILPPP